MSERTIEDQLRQEYFELLPEIRRVEVQLRAEVQYYTLPILRSLKLHEQLVVTSRVKECESAVSALRRRQEGATFDYSRPENYSLLHLKDLAAVRILAFPPSRLSEIDKDLRQCFLGWTPDPIPDERGGVLAPKYYGYCLEASRKVRGEFQVVSMLTGLFWDVEHSAIYKPNPELRGIEQNPEMRDLTREVYQALSRFEEGFERLVLAGDA
jgi:hypothetical protein